MSDLDKCYWKRIQMISFFQSLPDNSVFLLVKKPVLVKTTFSGQQLKTGLTHDFSINRQIWKGLNSKIILEAMLWKWPASSMAQHHKHHLNILDVMKKHWCTLFLWQSLLFIGNVYIFIIHLCCTIWCLSAFYSNKTFNIKSGKHVYNLPRLIWQTSLSVYIPI